MVDEVHMDTRHNPNPERSGRTARRRYKTACPLMGLCDLDLVQIIRDVCRQLDEAEATPEAVDTETKRAVWRGYKQRRRSPSD